MLWYSIRYIPLWLNVITFAESQQMKRANRKAKSAYLIANIKVALNIDYLLTLHSTSLTQNVSKMPTCSPFQVHCMLAGGALLPDLQDTLSICPTW